MTLRHLLCVGFAFAAAAGTPVLAQDSNSGALWSLGGHSYLGLSLSRTPTAINCPSLDLLCGERLRTPQLRMGTMLNDAWRVELGYRDLGRVPYFGTGARAQGLNLSLVGKARLGSAFGVYGKLGTTYGRADTAVLGAGPDQAIGLSWGGGVSYDITPRLSATFELESHDLRFGGMTRDPLLSTNLGLQYRY